MGWSLLLRPPEQVSPIADPLELLAEFATASVGITDDPEVAKLFEHVSTRQRGLLTSLHRFRCARVGRRGGKSTSGAYWLCAGWRRRPGQVSLYIARTRGSARDILWEELKSLNRRWNWGATPNESRLELRFPNGYVVRLRGAENQAQAEKLRGPHYWRVLIDECHLYPDELLKLLVESIIRPALADLRGEMILAGTPSYVLAGYWFAKNLDPEEMPDEAAKLENRGKQWPTFHWDMLENPFLPNAQEEMEAVVAEMYGGNWNHPEFLREWRGKNVRDQSALIYPFYGPRNAYMDGDFDEKPWTPGALGLRTIIGVDVGYEDGCGFSVAQKHIHSKTIRSPLSYSRYGMKLHEVAAEIKRLQREWQTRWVYVDSSAKQLIESLENFGILAVGGIGGEKRPRIEYTRALLQDGTLQLHAERCSDTIGEMSVLPWGIDKKTGQSDGKHREGFCDEGIDSLLIAALPLTQKYAEEAKPIPEQGTEEHERWLLEKRLREAHARESTRRGRRTRVVERKKPRALSR